MNELNINVFTNGALLPLLVAILLLAEVSTLFTRVGGTAVVSCSHVPHVILIQVAPQARSEESEVSLNLLLLFLGDTRSCVTGNA